MLDEGSLEEAAVARLFILLVLAAFTCSPARGGDWPQFRGPGGLGTPDVERPVPDEIGPKQNVLWKVPVPPGHSSPVVIGERIYLTAVRDKKLLTLALERATGKLLWEVEAPYRKLEKIHAVGSHAQATVASDGERVISFFGSCGLFCYNSEGKRLWHLPLGPFKNDLGAGSSPLLAGNLVILVQDHDIDSFLLAVDKRTGKVVWKIPRDEFWVSYASPFLWEVKGQKQIVVAGSLRVVGYDPQNGKELWTVRGLARAVHMTPTAGPDGTLYVAGWTAGGDSGERIQLPSFADMIARHDANKNGTIEEDELPPGPARERFRMLDRNKDGHITRAEWEFGRQRFEAAQNRVVAIRPGGSGDITKTHVVWSQEKYLPVIPSPLYYRGGLYLARNGGLLAVLDARTGKLRRQGRLYGYSNYYSSPVGADGKVWFASQSGDVTVARVEPEWRIVCRARFGEEIFATPAIVDGRIYLRTTGHLYCFGK
jgi:outer membrane protein assembly factor BamB